MRRLAPFVVAALAATGCMSGGTPISGDSRNVGDVTMTFRVEPSRVKAGQSVRLTLSLQNSSGRKVELVFPSGQKYDFWVTRDGRQVWRWSADRFFTQAVVRQTLEGQTGTQFSETWQTEGAGTYEAHARATAQRFERPLTGEVVVE